MSDERYGHEGLIHTSHENIPDYVQNPDTVTIKDGNWFDPTVWSAGVPDADKSGHVNHEVEVATFVPPIDPPPDPDPEPEPATLPVYLNDELFHAHRIVRTFDNGLDVLRIDYDEPLMAAADVSAVCKHLHINAGGKLRFAPGEHTELRVCTLTQFGRLQAGTPEDPITGSVNIIFRDMPIDTQFDPQQLGNGLLVLGDATLETSGRKRTPGLRVAAAPHAGDLTLVLSDDPLGWLPGDELWIPDTRDYWPWSSYTYFDQQERVVIESVNGNVVTLTQPLSFNHEPADGKLPHVFHLSSNITFRSENPNGVRGHIIITGRADIRLRDAVCADLGRTTFAQLDNTHLGPEREILHIGTNQIGRYTFHMHHVYGKENLVDTPSFELTGNVFLDGRKWGVAIHDTHYGLIRGNVIVGFQGAGLIMEDASEFANMAKQNFIGDVRGSGQDVQGRTGTVGVDPVVANDPMLVGDGTPENPFRTIGDTGHEGAGIWTRGISNDFDENVICNCQFAWVAWSRFLGNGDPLPETGNLLKGVRQPAYQGADTRVNYVNRPGGQQTGHEVDGLEIYACNLGLDWRGVGGAEPVGIPATDVVVRNVEIWGCNMPTRLGYDGDVRIVGGNLVGGVFGVHSERFTNSCRLENLYVSAKGDAVKIETTGHVHDTVIEAWSIPLQITAGVELVNVTNFYGVPITPVYLPQE
jgi:hypothetical protein